MTKEHGPIRDAALGAIAGFAGTWLMGRITSYLYEHENSAVRQREDAARGGKSSYVVAAEKAARAADMRLSDPQQERLGSAIHWGLGAAMGAVYGVLRRRVPHAGAMHGLAFGTAFWAIVDEAMNPVLGLTPGPAAFPWQTHARGLAGHLALGATADTLLEAADRLHH